MNEQDRLVDYFLQSGAYRELDVPVIVTSGEFLTPFFCSAENLCMDGDIGSFVDSHGDNPQRIIAHAVDLTGKHPEFHDVIDIISKRAARLLPSNGTIAVSGGQRRDWLFSGPVAANLNIPHISVFKPSANTAQDILLHSVSGELIKNPDLHGFHIVHIADLITKGSSIASIEPNTRRTIGWIPAIRERGGTVNNLITAVSRAQGAEKLLKRYSIQTDCLVTVDAEFIKHYSRRPVLILAFLHDPVSWTKKYLKAHGIEIILSYCVDDPKKLQRFEKFITQYHRFFEEMGWMETIDKAKRRNTVGDTNETE